MSTCSCCPQEAGGVDLIFHTNTESGKTDDLAKDPHVNVAFVNGTGEWASVSGEASVITDRSVVKKYYTPALKAWVGDLGDGKHDGGEDDPRIGVIKVSAKTATYAVSRSNFITRGVEVSKHKHLRSLRNLSDHRIPTDGARRYHGQCSASKQTP